MSDRLGCPNCYSIQLIKSGWEHGKQRYKCKRCGHRTVFPVTDVELVRENVRYRKEKQKAQDLNRIERKVSRNCNRSYKFRGTNKCMGIWIAICTFRKVSVK